MMNQAHHEKEKVRTSTNNGKIEGKISRGMSITELPGTNRTKTAWTRHGT